ncbi:alpha/beta hydrolase [Verrucomicrobiota bacterium]
MKSTRRTFILLAILVGVVIAKAANMDQNFYFPDRKVYRTPADDELEFEEVQFSSADGTRLNGWFIPAQGEALGTVVHFHGNAQNMTAHYSFVSWLPKNGFNLFVFDYRGYGKSEGHPTRDGVHQDSEAAVRYIKSRTDIDQSRIILFGQSIGGANAIAVLGANDFGGIAGIAVESAFSCYRRVASDHITILARPLIPLIVRQTYSPIKAVKDISPIPILFIHGTKDKIVPCYHSERLFEKAGEPKALWKIEGGWHTEALATYEKEYQPRLLRQFKEWIKKK